ncbi:MAG: hypothetical protein H6R26_438, partial [Proteobacteria bacterium]|nr:hypothetical protein [Pseudomonadota bacterium]
DADLLQRRVDDLERLLNVAADDGEIRRGGFSGYFEALARQAVPDVWLTGIRLTAGGREMELEGRSLDSRKIPLFVQALGRETVFAAKTFSNLAISRSEQRPGQVDFVLRIRTPGGDDDG